MKIVFDNKESRNPETAIIPFLGPYVLLMAALIIFRVVAISSIGEHLEIDEQSIWWFIALLLILHIYMLKQLFKTIQRPKYLIIGNTRSRLNYSYSILKRSYKNPNIHLSVEHYIESNSSSVELYICKKPFLFKAKDVFIGLAENIPFNKIQKVISQNNVSAVVWPITNISSEKELFSSSFIKPNDGFLKDGEMKILLGKIKNQLDNPKVWYKERYRKNTCEKFSSPMLFKGSIKGDMFSIHLDFEDIDIESTTEYLPSSLIEIMTEFDFIEEQKYFE